jgi:hypothetical protein
MLLGGETPAESYSPNSNGNTSANENENAINGNSENNNNNNNPTSPTTLEPSLANINLLQSNQVPSQQQQQQMTDDYSNKISSKDSNQNFLPENNLDMYQDLRSSQTSTHISPRVQPYDLNIAHQQAHHHHLRSSNHMNQQYTNGNNGRKISSPYKNLSLINHQSALTYVDNGSNGSEMMVLKEEPY